MSVLTIIAIVLAAWCAVSVVVAGLFSLAMRGMSEDLPAPPQATPSPPSSEILAA
jgi:hypothetical protein